MLTKSQCHFLSYLCFFQVRYVNNQELPQNKIGSIRYNFENLLDKCNSQIKEIQLNYKPDDLCILPNGQFIITNSRSNFIKVLSNLFEEVKTIYRRENTSFLPSYVASNGRDKVYFTEGHRVIQVNDF